MELDLTSVTCHDLRWTLVYRLRSPRSLRLFSSHAPTPLLHCFAVFL